jgi:hypothetical protein
LGLGRAAVSRAAGSGRCALVSRALRATVLRLVMPAARLLRELRMPVGRGSIAWPTARASFARPRTCGAALGLRICSSPNALRHTELFANRKELITRERPPLTRSNRLRAHAREVDAREPHHSPARRLAHAPDLLIAPLAQDHFDPRLIAFVTKDSRLRGQRPRIGELDAVSPRLEVFVAHDALNFENVRLRHAAARVEERVGEVTVVRHEEDAARRKIEATDWVHTRAELAKVLRYRRPALGVPQRGDDVPRLVQDEIVRLFRDETRPVDLDAIAPGIRLLPELANDAAVHADAAGEDDLLRSSARGEPSAGDDLLQSVFHRIPGAC